MKKKILTLLTLFVVVLGVSACDGSSLPSEYTLTFDEETLKTNGQNETSYGKYAFREIEMDVVVGKDIKKSDIYKLKVTPKDDNFKDTSSLILYFDVNNQRNLDEELLDFESQPSNEYIINQKIKDGDVINIILYTPGLYIDDEDLNFIDNYTISVVAE